MAESKLYPGEVVIDDDNADSHTESLDGKGKGLKLALRSTPFGQMYGSTAFPDNFLIPRSDWQGWIQELEESETRISDICLKAGLPCKNQETTEYCWINAPTHCVEILRVMAGQKMVTLSPASAGAPIKNFKNEGGWGEEGLKWIVDHGLCPTSLWPANAISQSYYTPANKKAALDYRVTEWFELRPRNLDQLVSCLLRGIPVAVGYLWWSHEVTACDALWLNGEVAIRFRNSWGMDWGRSGFNILTGDKMLPDDAVAPRVAIAAG